MRIENRIQAFEWYLSLSNSLTIFQGFYDFHGCAASLRQLNFLLYFALRCRRLCMVLIRQRRVLLSAVSCRYGWHNVRRLLPRLGQGDQQRRQFTPSPLRFVRHAQRYIFSISIKPPPNSGGFTRWRCPPLCLC